MKDAFCFSSLTPGSLFGHCLGTKIFSCFHISYREPNSGSVFSESMAVMKGQEPSELGEKVIYPRSHRSVVKEEAVAPVSAISLCQTLAVWGPCPDLLHGLPVPYRNINVWPRAWYVSVFFIVLSLGMGKHQKSRKYRHKLRKLVFPNSLVFREKA